MIKLLKNLRPYTTSVILISILVFARAIAELFLPTLMAEIVDIGIVTGNIPFIWKTGGIMLLVTLAGSLSAVASSYISARTASGFSRDVRRKVFHRVESFSLNAFDEIGTASMITRTTNDITQVQNTVVMMLRMMLYAPMMAIGGIVMAISKDPPLSILLVVVIPLIAGVIALIASKGLPLFTQIQKKIDNLTLVLRESLTGVRVIRAFNKKNHDAQRFDNANRSLTETAVKVNKLMAGMMPLMMLIFNFTTIAVIWFGSLRIESGEMLIGDLMAFIQYIMHIMFSLVMVTMMFIMIPRAAVSAVRINQILDKEPDIIDPDPAEISETEKTGHEVRRKTQTTKKTDGNGKIEFKNVSFRYHGAEEPAVCDISFTAEPGKFTAIIGGTGSGKSTIINLIPRFYDVHSGSITIDGRDVRCMLQKDLRNKIGLTAQKSVLFSGTAADNIRFGDPSLSLESVKQAAASAQADGFIEEMTNAYDAEISQGGSNVSGGQKQRIAIARALACKRDIYLFDDSFSALDFKTEAAIRKTIRRNTEHAAVLMVSQRISSVMQADTIIVMDDGKIVGQGRHRELLTACPVYREIAASQLNEEELA